MNIESQRLQDARAAETPWKKWGPYLSERQWGTVREDYSADGNAWDYFSHDQARSRAYHWGEDGLAGICDEQQRLCFALALWNGKDPIIKERLFGLTNSEGNHGEDVKEYYFYLDSTPTHSYMKFLYKYPQAAYPYDDLVLTNRSRGRHEPEYELLDTGVFDGDRYFDVFVEYVKESPEDILVQITVHNRGPEAAECHVLPTLWFRNQWSWGLDKPRPVLERVVATPGAVRAADRELGERFLYCDGEAALLFTENETNTERLAGAKNRAPFVKDAINNYLVYAQHDAVNPKQIGTKVAAHYTVSVPSGGFRVIRLRLTPVAPNALRESYGEGNGAFGEHFDEMLGARRREADEFYASIIPPSLGPDAASVMRQALAGMLWSKQFYFFDVKRWLEEKGTDPFRRSRANAARNEGWSHMYNADIISMPDKWEYPWYAAWDLAFHTLALTLVDPDFGKGQLELMLREDYLHPNGQIPAYEWNFGDVNPPVHAWATIFTFRLDQGRTGQGDVAWLERNFQKLLLSFSWWVNRKDRAGNNAFEGGFLGLDNIGVFDRSAPLPTGGHLEQADGTAWMALFSLNMLEINLELALHNHVYADMVLKFVHHFCSIASATIHAGGNIGMWDEEDGFFYDVLQLPDGHAQRLKVRSMVGLLPLCAVTVFESKDLREKSPELAKRFERFFETHPELLVNIHDPTKDGCAGRRLGAVLDETKLRRVLARMLDEKEFLGDYGLRALSRFHADNPYVFHVGDEEYRVGYLPGESDNGMFGGNSNWRGPVWMPVNALIIRALLQYYAYYGNEFTVECPTGSGRRMNLFQVAEEISRRLSRLFLLDGAGRRPANGAAREFEDPHWRDYIQFYEYFHGDSGAGLGANHQTGWTGIIARAMHLFATLESDELLEGGRRAFAKSAAGSS